MNRLMALDVGDVRVGIAMSDMLKILAEPFETYKRSKNIADDMNHFVSLIKEKSVELVVIGLPINMDGTHGERVDIVRKYGDELAKYTDITIVYQDERLTTYEAEQMLIEADVSREKRKQVIDKIAAAIILRGYMDRYVK